VNFVSDVHGAFSALRRVVELGKPVVILGDLANLTDYRTGDGAVADVLGIEFAQESSLARADGDYQAMRQLWLDAAGDRADEVRASIRAAIDSQYGEATKALDGGSGMVIHGNVDRPGLLAESLPAGFEYVHGKTIEVEGLLYGFVGGGVETPLRAEGELSDDEMSDLLAGMGPVDVLCSHVPPARVSLRSDVVTGRLERGSEPILEYVQHNQPRFHLFGDVHQPQATAWRLGRTRCFNAGYFRATGRYLSLENAMVQVGHIG
jgi:Icc-related predicted phosphoesterase